MTKYRDRARGGALIVIVLALVVLASACVPRPSGGPAPASGGPVNDLVNRHNGARANAGLPGFAVDPGLNGYAQFHAERLAGGGGQCNLWHSGELASWYPGHAAAENIACVGPCPSNGAAAMSMFLNSPTHVANILDGGFRYIGAGAACNGRVMFFVVHYAA